MNLIRNLDAIPNSLRGGAVAIGNFDGVHVGHAHLIERLLAKASELKGPAIVFTFEPHPVRLLRPDEAPAPLTWVDRKAALVTALGVDALIACPTTDQLLQLSPAAFFEQIVQQRLEARALIEGPNFRFGHDREGSIDVLQQLATDANVALDIVAPICVDGETVSSSRVRRLLADGQVDAVTPMLTQPYRLRGMVTHGAGRGSKIGFPTANLEAIDTLLPGDGVYAGRGILGEEDWPAAINIGPNPTFGSSDRKVEIHLIDCQQDLYGRVLEVDFFSRLRDIHPFGSVDQLKKQLTHDVEAARKISTQF